VSLQNCCSPLKKLLSRRKGWQSPLCSPPLQVEGWAAASSHLPKAVSGSRFPPAPTCSPYSQQSAICHQQASLSLPSPVLLPLSSRVPTDRGALQPPSGPRCLPGAVAFSPACSSGVYFSPSCKV